jgi:hypothetical protein
MFHLFNHAFFKALLFLGAGSVIHGLSGEQDMRRMGGLRAIMPITYSFILVASLSLAAFPYTSGYFSKEGIIENALFSDSNWGFALYWLGLLGSLFTTYYSTKLMYLVFWRRPQSYKAIQSHAHESPLIMITAMYPLAILSIVSGYFFNDLFVGPGSYFWSNSLHRLGSVPTVEHHFFMDPSSYVSLPLLTVFVGFFSALLLQKKSTIHIYKKDFRFPPLFKPLSWNLRMVEFYRFLGKRFYFDDLYNWTTSFIFYSAPRSLRAVVELHRLDGASLSSLVSQLAYSWSRFHQGYVSLYVQLMVFFLSIFVLLYFYPILSYSSLFVVILSIFLSHFYQGKSLMAGNVSIFNLYGYLVNSNLPLPMGFNPYTSGIGIDSLIRVYWEHNRFYFVPAVYLIFMVEDINKVFKYWIVSFIKKQYRRPVHNFIKFMGFYKIFSRPQFLSEFIKSTALNYYYYNGKLLPVEKF